MRRPTVTVEEVTSSRPTTVSKSANAGRRPAEFGDIANRLDIEPDGGHPIVVEQHLNDIGASDHRLVAATDDIAERDGALVVHQIDGDIAALRHQGGATAGGGIAEARGPDPGAVDEIDEAVAVRPEGGEIAGGLGQAVLMAGAAVGLGEARGIADRSARAGGGKRSHGLDGGLARHPDEAGVGRSGRSATEA